MSLYLFICICLQFIDAGLLKEVNEAMGAGEVHDDESVAEEISEEDIDDSDGSEYSEEYLPGS